MRSNYSIDCPFSQPGLTSVSDYICISYNSLHLSVRERLGEHSSSSKPEYVFRAASPDSSGFNTRTGLKAGLYADLAMDDIPNLDEIGTPGTQRAYSRQRLEDETLCHLNKYKRQLTGWISTTSSLLRALQILFIEHREKGQLFIIRTSACQDMFSAAELRDHLPGLRSNKYFKSKSRNEFLIRGKVESSAIVGCATVKSPQNRHLDIIAPGLGVLDDWRYKSRWDEGFSVSNLTHREVSTEILNAAVALAIIFDTKDSLAIVKRFLSTAFRICTRGLDDDRISDAISERALSQPSKNCCLGNGEA